MKKFIFQTIALCIAVQSMAQALCVKQSDGTISEFALSRVDSVSSVVTAYTGFENGHEWVDLGLYSGTLWATTNLGGASANSYGDYFAWGEITTKDSYTWENYTLANGSPDALTKYCNSSSYGTVDNKTTLEAADDAATQNWGGNWRMPTIDEWEELLEKCTWIWTKKNNVKGYEVKATNGNSIFLPAAGCRYDDERYGAGSGGYYWSSSLLTFNPNDPHLAQDVYFYSGGRGTYDGSRYYGRSVRPVYDEKIKTYTISLAEMENGTIALSDTTAPAGKKITLTITSNFGYLLQSLNVMCGENEVTFTDNSFIMPAGDVRISAKFAKASITGTIYSHDYVDLGLPSGTLWATCNVGATNPEDYGNYYAWGEIATKTTYDWSTYTLANGSSTTLTKYCNSSSYGTMDNKTTLEAADDAATANWGGKWRMPTIDEWQELIDKCTWTWTTKNSVGYEVKATNGNSIFLPAAGFRDDDELSGAGSYGLYWSSSLYTLNPYYAQGVNFNSGYHRTDYYYRYYGQSVRPVCEK